MVDVASRETVEQKYPDKGSCPESAPKQNDANGGGDEDASDGAHDMTKRKRASTLRYAGEQLRDER